MTLPNDVEEAKHAEAAEHHPDRRNQSHREDNDTASTTVKTSGSDTTTAHSRGQLTTASVVTTSVLETLREQRDRDEQSRKTRLYFGSCCDFRMACIITDIAYLCSAIIGLVLTWLGYNVMAESIAEIDNTYYDDDLEREEPRDRVEFYIISVVQITCSVSFASMGIWGSYKYRKCPVLATGIWFCIDLVLNAVVKLLGASWAWPRTLLKALVAYPHFELFHALRKGTITAENYSLTEKHCCCGRDERRAASS